MVCTWANTASAQRNRLPTRKRSAYPCWYAVRVCPGCEPFSDGAKQRSGTHPRFLGRSHAAELRGRSLKPLLSTSPPSTWRSALLVEHWQDETGDPYAATIPDYEAVRTGRYLLVRYSTGEKELYDLSNDPYELQSLHNSAGTELKRRLATRLDALEGCAAQSCRSAEN
jgi:hypothetical protein